jgi:hypothetical protein
MALLLLVAAAWVMITVTKKRELIQSSKLEIKNAGLRLSVLNSAF